jgi:serine/threonine protein kinase
MPPTFPSAKRLLTNMLMVKAPYNEEDLAKIRLNIMEQMKENTFEHYLNQMKVIREEIDRVLSSDAFVLDDEYWSKPGGLMEQTYWQVESPHLDKIYKKHLLSPTGGGVSVSNLVLSESRVEQLIGTADWMTIQQKILFKTMILTYFVPSRKSNGNVHERLWPIHLNMDFTFLNTRNKKKDESGIELIKSLFKSLLSGSGPFILKILQQINTSNDSKIDGKISVSDIAKDIFSTVPSLTKEEFECMKDGGFDIDQTYIEEMNPKVLGSASIAETHKTFKTFEDGRKMPVVMKFIKPIYAYYFLCEINFLLTDAWKELSKQSKGDQKYVKQTRKLLMFFIKEFIKEFDYYGEFVNTTVGHMYYNKPPGISSIIALECKVNPFPVLVLNFVEGSSIDSLLTERENTNVPFVDMADTTDMTHVTHPTYPSKKDQSLSQEGIETLYKSVDNLIKVWFKEVLWGSGFFHADLHPGNIIVSNDGTLNVIDFGSCGILRPNEQCAMITAMVISGKFKNMKADEWKTPKGQVIHKKNLEVSKDFVKAIWKVCHVENYTNEHMGEIAEKIIKLRYGSESGLNFSDLFLDIIQFSDDIGLCTNSPVLLFGRGCAYIGSLMKRVQEQCNNASVCPKWGIDGVITSNLISNFHQLIRFAHKGSVC